MHQTDDPRLARIAELFTRHIPHGRFLGLEVLRLAAGRVRLRVPDRPAWLGNAALGLWHGGVITSAIDSACGMAALGVVAAEERVVTLDLRVDYLRPAVGGAPLYVEARCYRLTRPVVFLRARAWQRRDKPVAAAVATFMRLPAASEPSESEAQEWRT
ncbi:MAG: hypothetical protein KatS3mg121_0909 [Gammaproteobacteria bacterium]|nr:MAG: hypothetical protein KatS3mg121_0909 [Gammaproteobacteria bacterium]